MLPLTLIMNSIIFKNRYFSDWAVFIPATLVLFVLLAVGFIGYGYVAHLLRNRLPHENETTRRLTYSLAVFFGMSAVIVAILLRSYEYWGFLGYSFDENHFKKAFIALVITNIFLTFLNEGVAKFESYQTVVTETEQLKKEYMHSQLLGLKSQMNPHFLFNSLNTLSSLIQENPEKAEEFLDHMTKVYRYLLRTKDEKLVALNTELGFIRSYAFLLKARHGEGLNVHIEVPPALKEHTLPPLTLQVIFESAINQNTISREQPLSLHITTSADNRLVIRNTVQRKFGTMDMQDEGLQNVSNKFRLLCQQEVVIENTPTERSLLIPLIPQKETSAL